MCCWNSSDHKRFKSGPAGTSSAPPEINGAAHTRSATAAYANGLSMSTTSPLPTSSIHKEDSNPAVTVAMLRELTRNIKRKYGET
jgi:hypothetical protein